MDGWLSRFDGLLRAPTVLITSQDDEEYAVVVNHRLLLKRGERDTQILRWG